EFGRHGRTVEGYELSIRTATESVNRSGDELFARTRFASNQHRRLRVFDSLNTSSYFRHRAATKHHAGQTIRNRDRCSTITRKSVYTRLLMRVGQERNIT